MMTQARGEIVIDWMLCTGCGVCEEFCAQKCIVLSTEILTQLGAPTAVFINPENCNACCICGWMCPHSCIEVYRYVDELAVKEATKAGAEKI
ncbi:MAG: ferredoxin family protein [Thermodesulfobacteriota bacterium]|nr:ferredoxin family protein [Thermodesulfobacteriota bacterium]